MYYKLGAEQIKGYVSNAGRSWTELGVNRPALRKCIVFGLVLFTVIVLMGGLAPTFAPHQTKNLREMFSVGPLGSR